jgi:AraC family transcriptional regulator of adaptative response/methylated-DNA-[protein]-cysteine methyltransferase
MTATHGLDIPRGRKKAGVTEAMHYVVRPCSLGLALIATSEKGVCALWFGDDAPALRDELRGRFPGAALMETPERRNPIIDAALAAIENPAAPIAFPIDARGTAFQKRVWEALRAVGPGRTASYTQIARAIGAPTAMRAVAGACAANPVAVAIPCHRILRNDGSLSGYRGGVARKRALLAREGVAVP